MDERHDQRILAFDSLFTTNHIQMLKLLLCYMEPNVQGRLAAYIKFRELQYTLQLITEHPHLSTSPCFHTDSPNISGLLNELLPFCDCRERDRLQNIKNMYDGFENIQEMMEMVDIMKEMMPEMFTENSQKEAPEPADSSTGSFEGFDLSQMMEMVNMLQGMFSGTGN